MTIKDDDAPRKTATETLAELVANRKAAQAQRAHGGRSSQKQTESAAAARSASKSKPAMRH